MNSSDRASRAQMLSECFTLVDEEILAEAFLTDGPEKMRELAAMEARVKGRDKWLTSPFGRVAAICACLILAVGILFGIPSLTADGPVPPINGDGDSLQNPDTPPNDDGDSSGGSDGSGGSGGSGNNDGNGGSGGSGDNGGGEETKPVEINSIDELNYYSAKKLMEDSGVMLTDDYRGGAVTVLGDSSGTYETAAISDEWIRYHELDPSSVFNVKMVIFLRIELRNERGFLASKVGTGTVDVVITQTDLDILRQIITFKNGDRYYSCLINGGKGTNTTKKTYIFSSHIYIEGFYVVKNLEQENYQFSVTVASDVVTDFECDYSEGISTSPSHEPDVATVVKGSGVVAYVSGSFTIAELEGYFNGEKDEELGI